MEAPTRALYWLLVAVSALGAWCWVGTVWWPGYLLALQLHLWLGIVLLVATIPALAWHVRRTATRLGPALVMPAIALLLVGWLMPGRPEYPAFGPIGWAALGTGAQLLVTAGVALLMKAPSRPPSRTSVSGVALTVAFVACLYLGLLGWLLRGDERWGPMLAHSAFGVFSAVLLAPHLLRFRRFVSRRWGVPAVFVALVALAWTWQATYPHDLVIADFRSPMDFDDEMEMSAPERAGRWRYAAMPRNAAERAAPPSAPLDADLVGDSMSCGDSGCHEVLTKQWAGSAHRFAADNDFYRKVVAELVAERGASEAAFCAACHDPVRVLTGTVETAYADGAPPPGEGVSCVACHGTWHVPDDTSNGAQVVREPRRYPGKTKEQRQALQRLDPRAHRQDLVSNFRLNDPTQSCKPCHRVVISPDMGAAITAEVQAAWRPEDRGRDELACTDCHMPTLTKKRDFEQAMYDHQVSGMALDLPLFASHPEADVEALEAVRDNTARFLGGQLDLGGLTDEDRVYEISDRTISVLREAGAVLLSATATRAGDLIELRTETRNHRAGHAFPIGPFDLNEVWQEVTVTDAAGEVVYSSGALDDDGRVDPRARRLGATELGRDGEPLRHHRIWDIAGIRGKRQIPQGGAVNDDYAIPLPEGAAAPFAIRVVWNYRRANPDFTAWVYGEERPFPVHELAVAVTTAR